MFAIPKPFRGPIAAIQQNAIRSWAELRPACEIILFGAEEGTAELSTRYGIVHVPNICRNEYGTPLLHSVFEEAERISRHPLMCYVNADIILLSDFMKAVGQVRRRSFLLCGQRWNLDLTQAVDFGDPAWEERLRQAARAAGSLAGMDYLDYFVFPRGFLGSLPAFAVGRPGWDNWLVYRARARWGAVIDASEAIMAVHQNHDYAHVPDREGEQWMGPEARRNLELVGGRPYWFTLADATHRLTKQGLKRALTAESLVRRGKVLGIAHPPLRFFVPFLKGAHRAVRRARRFLGGRQAFAPRGRAS